MRRYLGFITIILNIVMINDKPRAIGEHKHKHKLPWRTGIWMQGKEDREIDVESTQPSRHRIILRMRVGPKSPAI